MRAERAGHRRYLVQAAGECLDQRVGQEAAVVTVPKSKPVSTPVRCPDHRAVLMKVMYAIVNNDVMLNAISRRTMELCGVMPKQVCDQRGPV